MCGYRARFRRRHMYTNSRCATGGAVPESLRQPWRWRHASSIRRFIGGGDCRRTPRRTRQRFAGTECGSGPRSTRRLHRGGPGRTAADHRRAGHRRERASKPVANGVQLDMVLDPAQADHAPRPGHRPEADPGQGRQDRPAVRRRSRPPAASPSGARTTSPAASATSSTRPPATTRSWSSWRSSATPARVARSSRSS